MLYEVITSDPVRPVAYIVLAGLYQTKRDYGRAETLYSYNFV